MKVILYAVAILIACAAAFFSFSLSNKFETLRDDRLVTIDTNKKTTAKAEAAEAEIKRLEKKKADLEEAKSLAEVALSTAKATGNSSTNEIAKLDEELKAQAEEDAQLQKTLEEVKVILADLGADVNIDNLPEKIQQIEDDKKAKTISLEEHQTLATGAEKTLEASRAELDRLTKKMIDRSARIRGNAMTAVVTAVNQDWGFLVIGAGSNSGFTPQTSLLVERDGRKIGRVRPSSIEPTQTIAEIDTESLAAGVRLQPGDRVILADPATN